MIKIPPNEPIIPEIALFLKATIEEAVYYPELLSF
jgi:hypothetical protein